MKRSTSIVVCAGLALWIALPASTGQIQTDDTCDQFNQMLVSLIQEEKLARDVYQELGSRWDLPVFTNTVAAEQRHLDVLTNLLDQRGHQHALKELKDGQFADEAYTQRYRRLLEQGKQSLTAALQVGAEIEEADLVALTEFAQAEPGEEMDAVAQCLLRATRNHLRAYMGQLKMRGATYKPQHLAADVFQEILAAPKEAGGCGACCGQAATCGLDTAKECPGKGLGKGKGAAAKGSCCKQAPGKPDA